MTTKRLIPLLLQLVLAISGQQLFSSAAFAQEQTTDAAAATTKDTTEVKK